MVMKGKNYKRDISSRKWIALRKSQLTMHPLCQRCETMEVVTSATEVHHRTPVESTANVQEQRRLMYDAHNLMSVCHSCHVELHRGLGSHTKAEAKRRAEAEAEEAIGRLFGV